jgi:Fur family ferric uptake transcriptional regulator
MASLNDLFIETLRNNGYSVTKARQAVFEALENQEPQSMGKLVAKLRDSIDKASIYRTVALFEKLGIVHRLQLGWKYKIELADTFNYHHHHISCSSCHRVFPIREDVTLEAAMQALAQEYGFRAQSHQVEIQGLCSQCQQKHETPIV